MLVRDLPPERTRPVIARVDIGGRIYLGRGKLVDGNKDIAILTLTPLPPGSPLRRGDVDGQIEEVR